MQTLTENERAQLVKKAQLGDKDSLNRLAEEARVYLHEYVMRLTLQKDLTQDIVQESILEMFKVFHKLKNADRFLAWLDGIAFNKVRSHYGRKWRHKTISLSDFNGELACHEGQNALADTINNELKQIVIKSMRELAPRYRAIIIMRCYKDMSFSEIAESLSCTKFGAQSLFYRAKRSLAKKLGSYGLGKGSLLMALVLFGKLTSTSEAAAANLAVTAATLNVGTAATLAGMVASKTAIVSLVAAGALTGGTVAVNQGILSNDNQNQDTNIFFNSSEESSITDNMQQSWLYFPDGSGNSVMMRLLKYDDSGQNPYCQYMQNQHANYYYDNDTVSINNSRIYNPDLSVARLPNDNVDMSRFISRVEGRQSNIEHISGNKKGLLLISGYSNDNKIRVIDRYSTILEEEYFQSNWPQSTKVVDNRDEMHKRGWTYFTVEGNIGGKNISGTGQIPLVYEASNKFRPWLKIQLSDGSRIIDTNKGACIVDKNGKTTEIYQAGTFFSGLSRPWMGLHSVDTVRRDAAKEHIEFETKLLSGTNNAEVTLTYEQNELVYTIDMKNDLVKKIVFSSANSDENELRFNYLQNIDDSDDSFVEPIFPRNARSTQNSPGIKWLVELVNNNL
ncbi:MAG: RNA polymerase sigma factor [Sedimentisphaerales bacterium]|nr:RNA polymerase sigma factor [Sedimentisphaerales bacterium]